MWVDGARANQFLRWIMKQRIYKVEDLIKYLETLPQDAEIEVNGQYGIEVEFIDMENTLSTGNW